jgi:hypothetical protein
LGFSTNGGHLLHRTDAVAARPYVAVVGLGLGRRNPEGDDAAFLDRGEALTAAGAEFFGANHEVIRSERQHGLGASIARIHGCCGHGRAGIAPQGLDQDVDLHADVARLLLRHEPVGFVGAMIGRRNRPRSATRSSVCWKVDCLPSSGTNCLGMLSRESGHRRLPEPPTRMTGVMRDIGGFRLLGG